MSWKVKFIQNIPMPCRYAIANLLRWFSTFTLIKGRSTFDQRLQRIAHHTWNLSLVHKGDVDACLEISKLLEKSDQSDFRDLFHSSLQKFGENSGRRTDFIFEVNRQMTTLYVVTQESTNHFTEVLNLLFEVALEERSHKYKWRQLFVVGLMARMLEGETKAVEIWRQVKAPFLLPVREEALALEDIRNGNKEAAILRLERLLQVDPYEKSLYRTYADILFADGQVNRAAKFYKQALKAPIVYDCWRLIHKKRRFR